MEILQKWYEREKEFIHSLYSGKRRQRVRRLRDLQETYEHLLEEYEKYLEERKRYQEINQHLPLTEEQIKKYLTRFDEEAE